MDAEAERRIVAQIEAIRQDVAEGRGASATVSERLDALAAAVHEQYANGPGIGPRVVSLSDSQALRAEAKGPWQAVWEWPFARLMDLLRFFGLDKRPLLALTLVVLGLFSWAVAVVYEDFKDDIRTWVKVSVTTAVTETSAHSDSAAAARSARASAERDTVLQEVRGTRAAVDSLTSGAAPDRP